MKLQDQYKIYEQIKTTQVILYSYPNYETYKTISEYKYRGFAAASKGNFNAAYADFEAALTILSQISCKDFAVFNYLNAELSYFAAEARKEKFCVMVLNHRNTEVWETDFLFRKDKERKDEINYQICNELYRLKISALEFSINGNYLAADSEYDRALQISNTSCNGYFFYVVRYLHNEIETLRKYNKSLLERQQIAEQFAKVCIAYNAAAELLMTEINLQISANDLSEHSLQTLQPKIKQLSDYMRHYETNSDCLDAKSLTNLNKMRQVKSACDRFEQRARDSLSRATIYKKLQLVIANINQGKIPEAYKEADAALATAKSIVNREFFTVTVDCLTDAVKILNKCQEDFKLVRTYQAKKYAAEIMEHIQHSYNDNDGCCWNTSLPYSDVKPHGKIYEHQLQQVRAAIEAGFTNNWHKFYLRASTDLRTFKFNAYELISQNVKLIGFKKWASGFLFYADRFTTSIDQCDQMLKIIALGFDQYQPKVKFEPTQEMAAVIASLNIAPAQGLIPIAVAVPTLIYDTIYDNGTNSDSTNRCRFM